MSINVTVSGNPVRINRGKMVTAYDPSKNDFEKRRIMRIEQVRQQSKDIAENLRNKHKKAKSRCLSEVEKEGEVKIKNWQARKLLELQNQYQEALDDIGLGHKGAASVEEEEDVLLEVKESNEKVAKERGRIAAERLQIEKNEANLKKAVPRQRKIFLSDAENSRASTLVKGGKKVKKRQVFDSDEENQVPLLMLDEDSNVESHSSDYEEVLRKRSEILKTNKQKQSTAKTSKEQQTSVTKLQVVTSDKAAQTVTHEDPIPHEFPLDTRISERIKRRVRLNPENDYCDFHDNTKVNCCAYCQCPVKPQEKPPENDIFNNRERTDLKNDAQNEENAERIVPPAPKNTEILFQTDQNFAKESENIATEKSGTSKDIRSGSKATSFGKSLRIDSKKPEPTTKSTIPSKPKVTLRATKDRPVYIGSDPQPVKFYDHPNRYSRSYVPKTSHVEKIDDDELIVSPNIVKEDEIREKIRQRDIEAHIRGQVALEKEKIQREYRDLLKKLPALQKQERIFEIGTDKEKYHMSRDRLEELEKKRQNRLDNAYEELFVRQKPAVVTLPKRAEEKNAVFSLNLASWDVDYDPHERNKTRCETLSHLLSNLKSNKQNLLKEIESSLSKDAQPSSDDVKSKSTDYTQTKRRKRSRDERPVSPASSYEESSKKTKSRKGSTISTTGTTSIPSPRKKQRLKSRKVLILQNTSTQTTPQTASTQSTATSPISKTPDDACSCNKDDVCEIVIKIKDDEKPEVQVNPPFMSKSVKVIAEDSPKSPKVSEPWKDQLTQSGSSHSTTSTSYLEPPSSGGKQKKKKTQKGPQDVSKSMDSTASERRLDPRLLRYIRKLLNMSRGSIDDLTVSSASDVSTPSHSVLETPTNNPLHRLMNVMKYYNLDVAQVQKELSYVSDESSKHYNTAESVAVSGASSRASTVSTEAPQYAEIAAHCAKKINNLTAMIEKVREEKKKMLESSTSGSDRDLTTTSYRDLPDRKEDSSNDDLGPLLNLDYSYAAKLRQMTKEEIQKQAEEPTDDELLNRLKQLLENNEKKPKDAGRRTVIQETQKTVVQESDNHIPVALTLETKLTESSKDGKTAGISSTKTKLQLKPTEETRESPPLFLDIPKLPRLEASDKKKKRPPICKGVRIVEGNPHELSTIVEADSQLSTKVDSPDKEKSSSSNGMPDVIAEAHSQSSGEVSERDTIETMLVSIGMNWALPTLKKTREALAMTSSSSGSKESGEKSLMEFLSRISASSSSGLSDSHGMSLIDIDTRKTSTPILSGGVREGQPVFHTDSDLSSVREHSKEKDDVKSFDYTEGSLDKNVGGKSGSV